MIIVISFHICSFWYKKNWMSGSVFYSDWKLGLYDGTLILILSIWKSCRNWKFSFSGKRKAGVGFLLGPVESLRDLLSTGVFDTQDFMKNVTLIQGYYETIIVTVYWLKKRSDFGKHAAFAGREKLIAVHSLLSLRETR